MDAQRVGQAFWASVIVFTLIGVYFYLTQPAYDYGPPRWRRWVTRYIMSRDEARVSYEQALQADNSPATTTQQNSNNGVATPQNDSNALLLLRASDLAKMVHAGKVGETEGIRLIFGVAPSSSNPKYIAARAALKAELAKLTNTYPQRTPEQEQLRKELGIAKP